MEKYSIWSNSPAAYPTLERGRFEYPNAESSANGSGGGVVISWRQLMLIIEGIDLRSVRQRKRFSFPVSPESKSYAHLVEKKQVGCG